ncbi:STAS domain-containing protein, partial [bacterium]|nr:STAS domain-containing protein [bacterium]
MEGIQVSIEKAGPSQNIAIIKVGGYIDTTTSAELEHALSSVLKSNCYNIIIDLGNVDYISSAGWGIFISEIKGIRENHGDLKLVRMIPDVYEVFELLEFHYILKAFDTLEDAIHDFDQAAAASMPQQEPTKTDEASQNVQVAAQPQQKVIEMEEAQIPMSSAPNAQLETIEDKVKRIIIENPDATTLQIIRNLNSNRYGNIKLNWFAMRRYLKRLDLDSKKKRRE